MNSGEAYPVIPLPNPGEGGPVDSGDVPVPPLPNPGESGPVANPTPRTSVRFLNAAYGYKPFRILINQRLAVRLLHYGGITSHGHIGAGYQTITITGTDGYIYIQKSLPFEHNTPYTVAIINTASGLDLVQIPDTSLAPSHHFSNFRVSNLAFYSNPVDVLLRDGRVVYADVRFKETTSYKRIRPGFYQFVFAETNFVPMPVWQDIETMETELMQTAPPVEELAVLDLRVQRGVSYTIFLLSTGPSYGLLQTLVVAD